MALWGAKAMCETNFFSVGNMLKSEPYSLSTNWTVSTPIASIPAKSTPLIRYSAWRRGSSPRFFDRLRLFRVAQFRRCLPAALFPLHLCQLPHNLPLILRDLRVSITDRCNFRCLYCLPETEAAQNFYRGHWAKLPNSAPIVQQWVPRAHILSFEEIERVIRLAVSLGIQKIRLTGGEPLLRHDVEDLVARIAAIPGLADLAMTTNGFFFQQKGRALRAAGLHRISFSLDSLSPDNFRKITGRDGLDEVLKSISLAQELGLHPVKVNAVIIRGINRSEE